MTQDNDEDNLAWGALVGIDWDSAEGWVAELAYGYINPGDIDTGPIGPGERITAEDYVCHDILPSTALRFQGATLVGYRPPAIRDSGLIDAPLGS